MNGITFEELYDFIAQNHEAEFTYLNEIYTIEPDVGKETAAFEIWKYGDESDRICRVAGDANSQIRLTIDRLLNQKCFHGKSFMEIEREVTVETIY